MKRWALVVVALYALILGVLTVPVGLMAFAPKASAKDIADAYRCWPYWLWMGVMVLGQAALLVVPVRVTNRRPVAPVIAVADRDRRVDDRCPRCGGHVFPV